MYSFINITINNLNSNGSVELFADDINYTSLAFNNANSLGTANIQKHLTPGKYYLDITADAYDLSTLGSYPWEKPYFFNISSTATSSINEHSIQNRTLIKITDILGRETKEKNQFLLYLYDDGTVEKRIVIE